MTEQNITPDTNIKKCCKCCGWKKKLAILLGVAVIAGLGFAAGKYSSARSIYMGMGHRFMEHRVEKMLNLVDATPDQREKIKLKLASHTYEFAGMREEFRKNRIEIISILGEPVINREKIEALRLSNITKMQDLSSKMSKTMADVAEELSLEQRQKLIAEFKKRSHTAP